MRQPVTRGLRLQLLRTARRIGLGELAERAGYSSTGVANIEHDRFGGRDSTLDDLAKALGVRRAALDDDRACLDELARLVGVTLLVEPSPDAELVQLVAGVPPERREAIVTLVRGMVVAFGLPPLPPGATTKQQILRYVEEEQLVEKAKRGK